MRKPAPSTRNLFACLVHESPDCVVDLVRNLRHLDPDSAILLYNGSANPGALAGTFPFEQYGAVIHPHPRPMAWGRLHQFALDCMSFALAHVPFDTMTIVDSDMLGTRPGYSQYLFSYLQNHPAAGLLSNSPAVKTAVTDVGPVRAAFAELELWRPFLRQFPNGEQRFAYWSFWPSTVFTADAARDLTRLFANDRLLQEILSVTQIWATEEVILPTLTALLGYEIVANPCSHQFVRYRVPYTPAQIDAALGGEEVYWAHPIPRQYTDPLRSRIRTAFGGYPSPVNTPPPPDHPQNPPDVKLLLSLPIIEKMKTIEGWLSEREADLLIAATARAIGDSPAGAAIVEVGSYCGRGTVVLASVVQSLDSESPVYAIDLHDGKVGAVDQGLRYFPPSFPKFRQNIQSAGLAEIVKPIVQRPAEVDWHEPIALLLIDGLHDYVSVAEDFHRFEDSVVPGGYVAFHDYADYYPGVKRLVNALLAGGLYDRVRQAETLIVLRKRVAVAEPAATTRPIARTIAPSQRPLVSCIMATADRRAFVPESVGAFLRQDYPDRELIIVDDGRDPVADLIPADDRIRYVRLPSRRTIGAKHNMACELARGELMIHWDDDDWHAAWRLSYQVKAHLRSAGNALSGLSRIFFYEPGNRRAWEYSYPPTGKPWIAGATFCYRRRFWETHRFPDMDEGVDTVFVWNLNGAEIVPLEDPSFYVATIHPANTSRKQTQSPGWQPRPAEDIHRLLDDAGRSFYERIGSAVA